MLVIKKIEHKIFDDVLTGKKKAEFRLCDFEVNEGDTLRLVEVDDDKKETGRFIDKQVTYIWKCNLKDTYWPVEEIFDKGIQIISFE